MATVGECIVGCVFEIFIYIYRYIIFNFCEIINRYINIFVYTIKNQKRIQYSHHNQKKALKKPFGCGMLMRFFLVGIYAFTF